MQVLHKAESGGTVQLPSLNPPILFVDELRESRISSLKNELTSITTYIDTNYRSFPGCDVSQETKDDLFKIITSAVQQHTVYHLKAKHVYLSEPLCFICNNLDQTVFGAKADSINETGVSRKLTSITFINDDFEGGELTFPTVYNKNNQPIKFRPIPGVIVIFPSDLRFEYELKPVTNGVCYAILGWFEVLW